MSLTGWKPLTNIRGKSKQVGKPKHIRFPDGHTVGISYWIDVLKETAKWLVDNGKLTRKNARVRHPRDRSRYVSSDIERKHPSGRQFTNHEEIGAGVYLQKNWTAQDSVDGAKELLKHCGVDPSTIQVID